MSTEDDFRRLVAEVRELRLQKAEMLALMNEVWNSIPATYDPEDPMVKRHAVALNSLKAYCD